MVTTMNDTKIASAFDVTSAARRKDLPGDFRHDPGFGKTILDALEHNDSTARELARATGVSELIVRSVLEALTHVGSVDFDPETGRYSCATRG